MRKSFTRLFGFLLLSVMMLFSFGLYAQEQQSTVELKAPTIDVCYNAGNSYTATITTKDFIKMRSFHVVLAYDQTEFGLSATPSVRVTNVNPALQVAGYSLTSSVASGKITIDWTVPDGTTSVTIGDNAYASLFNVNFNVLGFPNNAPDNQFDSPLTWDASSAFYFGENYTGSYQVGTNAFVSGSMNVGVTYGALTANDYTISSTNCYGSNVNLTITNPVGAGFQYSFNNGATWQTSPSASVVAPSTVNIRIKNGECFSHLTTVDVTAPSPLVMTAPTTTNAICNGQKGSIVFNYTGGVSPYVYYVVPSAQMDDVLALQVSQGADAALAPYKYTNYNVQVPAGSYYIAMTAGNCNQNLFAYNGFAWVRGSSWYGSMLTITQPVALPAPTWNPYTNNTCYGGMDGSIDVAGAPYSSFGTVSATINGVDWVTVATGFTEFTGLAGGTYTVTVKNATGCTNYNVVTLVDPDPIVFTPSYTDATCVTASNTTGGSIYISSVSPGARTSYEYVVALAGADMPTTGWQTVSAGTTSATASFTNLAPNYYSVWVRSISNPTCVKAFYNQNFSGNVLPIQAPGALSFTTDADDTHDVICNGSTFTMTVTASGGSNSYTYTYDGVSAGFTRTKSYAAGTLTQTTTVDVIVTDTNGCSVSRTVTIDVPAPLTLAITGDVVSPTCKGNNDGRVVVTAGGGTVGLTGIGGYQYSTDGLIWFDSNVIAIKEGTTTVSVRDANLTCTTSIPVTVTALPASTITATQFASIDCFGAKTGTISVTQTSWISNPARNVKYYYATTNTPAAVFGGTVFAESGATTPTTFYAGTYYVGAMDEFGCQSNIVTVVVKQKDALAMAAPVIKDATCFGNTDGTITINTTGGNGRPSYYYANSLAALSAPGASFLPITTWVDATSTRTAQGSQVVQVQKGTYFFVIKDNCSGRTVTSTAIEVKGYDAITLPGTTKFTVVDETCDANNGKVTFVAATGGKVGFEQTGNYTYKLTKATGGSFSSTVTAGYGQTVEFANLEGGAVPASQTYSLTVTDGSGCGTYTLGNIVIKNNGKPRITNVAVTHFSCADANNGKIVVTADRGYPGYQLAVNASANGVINESDWLDFGTSTSTTSKIYNVTEPGVYYLYVRDAVKCVGNTYSVTVFEPAALTLTGVATNVTCADGGSVKLSLGGGWTPAQVGSNDYIFTLVGDTYTSTVPVSSTSTVTTYEFTGLPVGNYTVTVTDDSEHESSFPTLSCPVSYKFSIGDVNPYQYKATVVNTSCIGSSTGSLKVDVLAGTASNTQYFVQLTTSASPILTQGGWVSTTGTGTATRTITFSNLPHAIYNVWISNGKPYGADPYNQDFCLLPTGTETPTNGVFTKVAGWEINDAPSGLTASVTLNNDVTCNGGTDGKFTVNAAGGWGGYTYAVKLSLQPDGHEFAPVPANTEFVSSPVFTKGAGTYVIWVKDQNGCVVGGEGTPSFPIDSYRVRVKQPRQLAFAVASNPVTCFGTATGQVMVRGTSEGVAISEAANGGTGTYTIAITGFDASGVAVNITATLTGTTNSILTVNNVPASVTGDTATATFKVTVTDANGCTNSGTIIVRQKTQLTATLAIANGAFLCPGDVNGVVEARPVGGTGTGTYSYRLWKNGVAYTAWVSDPSFIVQVGFSWKIEVKDGGPCTTFTNEQYIAEPLPVVPHIDVTTCYGNPAASVNVWATGQANRTFSVRYRLNTDAYPATWTALPSTGKLPIGNLVYANGTPTQNFYYFQIKDNEGGCVTETIRSFVPTQHPVEVSAVQNDLTAKLTISGGISPYTIIVGNAAPVTLLDQGDKLVNLMVGANTITVTDAQSCTPTTTLNFTVAPLTVTAAPAIGDNQTNSFAVALTFNRDVPAGIASLTTVSASTGTPTVAVTGSGKTYTATITAADLATVTLALSNGIMDAAGNTLSATTFTYTIGDHSIPTVTVTDPATPVAKVFTVGLTFSEPVSGVASGVTVTGGTAVVSGSGASYSLTVTAPEQTKVTIVLTNAIADLSANANKLVAVTKEYTTGDFTAPTATYTPNGTTTPTADNHPSLQMTFNEDVAVATGNVKIYKASDNTLSVTIPVTAAMLSGKTVSLTYAGGLDKNTNYYVLVDGVVKDLAGNAFAGVTASSTWTFKTGANFATGIDPINNSLEFKVYPNPFVDFVTVTNASELSKVVVSNIAGQVVKEVVNPESTIQLNQLVSGVYFISLYQENVVIKTVKIVKR